MSLVSVVVPVYNVEIYLSELLQGLCNQTFSDIEIICVDDGSMDKSAEIIKNYQQKDKRIKYFYQENQGGGVARNTGIKQACSKYVICLDADDIYEKNMIELLFNQAEKTDADITICDFNQIDMQRGRTSHHKGIHHKYLPDKEVFSRKDTEDILQVTNPGPCNKLYKLDFIKQNNLNYSATKTVNDLSFSAIALAIAEKITIVDKELSTYRYMSVTSGSKNRAQHAEHCVVSFYEIYNALLKHRIFEELRENYIKKIVAGICYELSFSVGYECIDSLKEFLSNKPFCEINQEELKKIFNICNKKKQFFEYFILNILTLGLRKSLKIRVERFKNLLKNLKLLGIY